MTKTPRKIARVLALAISVAWSSAALADVYTFNFTGRMTVAAGNNVLQNIAFDNDTQEWIPGDYQMPISAALTYDTVTGLGGSPLSVTLANFFYGQPTTFHDITLSRIGTSNLFNGQMLVDWATSLNMPTQIEWDATGFLNAVNSGVLAIGDKISGDVLLRDMNNDGTYNKLDPTEVIIASLGSATPYTDTLIAGTGVIPQYHAPFAATSGTHGFGTGTPFIGIQTYLDIGSGNSMYVTGIASVPEPETWGMFLAGLVLLGFSTRGRLKT